MNKLKKIFVSFVSLLIIFSICTCITVSADTYYEINNFKFKYLDDGTAMIAEYNGNSNVLIIPDTLLGHDVSSVEPNAFMLNKQIEYVEFGKNFTTISAMSFAGSALKEVILPSSMKLLVWGAFQECPDLKTVTVLDSDLIKIPETCFYNCKSLTEVNLGNNISTIEKLAFSDCTSLKSITIPRATTSIAPNAFRNCSNLTIKGYKDSFAEEFALEAGINFEIIPEYEIGDVDLNGIVNVNDATLIQYYAVSIKELPDYQLSLADVNGDGVVNVLDATQIQRILVGFA